MANEAVLTKPQQEMLQFLENIRATIISGKVDCIALITTGADGINCGFSDGNAGGLMIGTELLKSAILNRVMAPAQRRSPIIRPGHR